MGIICVHDVKNEFEAQAIVIRIIINSVYVIALGQQNCVLFMLPPRQPNLRYLMVSCPQSIQRRAMAVVG